MKHEKLKIVSLVIVVFGLSVNVLFAQSGRVGVNTDSPKATMEVAAKTDASTQAEGILVPRLTGDQVTAMPRTGDNAVQTSTLVYVTDAASASNQSESHAADLSSPGFFHYDGVKWVRFVDTDTQYENIYTTDGTLTAGRTVIMADNDLTYQGGVVHTDKDMDIHGVRVGHGEGAQPNNIAIGNPVGGGNGVLGKNTTGNGNIAIGVNALRDNMTGNGNLAIGYSAAAGIITGTNNIAIGKQAVIEAAAENRLNIGNSIYGENINDGDVANDKIGIGTASPAASLHVEGDARITILPDATGDEQAVMVDVSTGELRKKTVPTIISGRVPCNGTSASGQRIDDSNVKANSVIIITYDYDDESTLSRSPRLSVKRRVPGASFTVDFNITRRSGYINYMIINN